ncbi:hypothetical protein Mal64_28060 [Pseudobythopirellula maris]|uniref:Uncharacterized protein n=1 Tax=Pseudobythopirellula maris TaxID=2527991 RepID=A0A5C5ZJB1_9BACT|nr:hypothetical protein Mal64_28060 [Pseudobythopirellula maris]
MGTDDDGHEKAQERTKTKRTMAFAESRYLNSFFLCFYVPFCGHL